MTDICGISPLPLKINHMKQLFLTLMAVLGISVCPGQTLADILNTRYDNNPVPTVPVEYTLPKLVAKTPFIQLFNSLLLATGQSVFHSDEYEADDRQIELYGVLFRYPHRPNRPIGWMPWQGKTIIFNGDNPGLFTPLEEARYFRYKDYPENSLYHLEDDNDPTWHFLQEQVWEHVEVKGLSGSMDCHLPYPHTNGCIPSPRSYFSIRSLRRSVTCRFGRAYRPSGWRPPERWGRFACRK